MKLRLLGILYALTIGFATAQIEMVEMTVEDYEMFLQDTRDKKALEIGIRFLRQENNELRMLYRVHTDSLQKEIDQLNETIKKQESSIIKLEKELVNSTNQVQKAFKIAEGHKVLTQRRDREIARLKGMMTNTRAAASIKVGVVILAIGLFIGGIFVIMEKI